MIYKRIYKWSIFLTALVSFWVWNLVSSIADISWISSNLQILVKFVIGAFFSYGFFIGIVSLLYQLIEKCKCIKKLVFASTYIEGVWIGFSITEDNEIILIVQQIEQTSDKVSVYGHTLEYNNGNPIFRGSISPTGATFDSDKHTLNVTYMSDKKKGISAGFGSHQFINRGKKAPDSFFGYSANYGSHGKRFITGKRYCEFEKMPDLNTMVKEAKRFYEGQKELFDNQESAE